MGWNGSNKKRENGEQICKRRFIHDNMGVPSALLTEISKLIRPQGILAPDRAS